MNKIKSSKLALAVLLFGIIVLAYCATCSKKSSSKDTVAGTSGTPAATTYTLSIQTSPDTGASITVTPDDNNSQGNGTSNFTREYNSGASVTLTAPASYSSKNFSKWKKDGLDYSSNASITITVNGNYTLSATYLGATPTLTAVSPITGYNDLYTPIYLTGTNFSSGATVKIGVASALSVTFVSSTLITATVNYGLTGGTAYDVTITNPDTQTATLASAFTATSPPAEWAIQTLTWTCPAISRALTSTCTITNTNKYRTYFTAPGGIWTITTTDGTNLLGNPVFTGVDNPGATNPAVISLTNGTYLMIYGVQLPGPTEQLYRATSNDGITFTKQGVVLTPAAGDANFLSVLDLVYISGTRLRMYFVASPSASWIHTAYSDDNGATWTREGQITINGGPVGNTILDPDIITTTNGYRLFFTTPPVGQSLGNLRIRSAVSTDGRIFTLESGNRLTASGQDVLMDPDAILMGGSYRIYYGGVIFPSAPADLKSITSP